MATDISSLRNKVENEGLSEQGMLSASEFNRLVDAVMENQGSVKSVKYGSLDPIAPDANGLVTIPMISDSWTDVLRIERGVVRDYEETYETVADEGVYLYKDTNVPLRLRFQEYRQQVDDETDESSYQSSGARVTIRIFRETANGETELGSFGYTARGFGSTEWENINMQSYLSAGANNLIFEVTNSSKGEATRRRLTIVAANLSIEVATDNNWQNKILDVNTATDLTAEYHVGGAVDRTLCVVFTGNNGSTSIYRTFVAAGSSASAITTATLNKAEDRVGFFSEGLKTIEAWVECSIGEETISTQETALVNHIIAVEGASQNKYVAIQSCITSMLNYEAAAMFEYNIYSPDSPTDVTFVLADENRQTEYLSVPVAEQQNGKLYKFTNNLSIQTQYNSVRVYIYAKVGGEWVNGGARLGSFLVDNSEDFGAVDGAAFYLNPMLRSNQESNPARIVNAATGEEISGCQFDGISWQDGVDGWITANNVRMLRLLAGSTITIPYNIYSDFTDDSNHGLTVEIDFAVRNITNEEDPVLTIGNRNADNPKGIYMKALNGAFMSRSNGSWAAADVSWQEGVRTHLVFNFQHNYVLNNPEQGRGVLESARIAILRTYINGVINREFRVNSTDNVGEINAGGDIVIGQVGTDIDIYGIRVYKQNLTPENVVKNYISTLPTVAEKKKVFDANNILSGGVISFEKARAAGYNCIVWHGTHISRRYSNNPKRNGYAEIYQYADGVLDKAHSGTLYGIEASGQGTTAMTYADWNFSFKEDKKTGAGHDEFKYSDEGTLRNVFVDMDGKVGFGKTKFGYQLDDGDPTAKKLVGKINYASSMQSHKMGACNLYNDLYRECVTNSITNFAKNQRVTVKEKPFLYFVQEVEGGDDALKVFKGLCTFGPGKADKPTWGVDDDTLKAGDSLVEGALNNNPLTDMRVPFVDTINPTTGRYVNEYQLVSDSGAKMEAFVYAGAKNINWGFGDTLELHDTGDVVWAGVREGDKGDADAPTTKQVKMWQPIWNFLYLMNTKIAAWGGTLRELNIAAQEVSFDTSVAYWMTTTAQGEYNRFDLYRCHYNADGTREYVRAGLRLVQGNKVYINLDCLYDITENPTGLTAYTDNDLWYDVSNAATDTRDVTFNLQSELNKMISKHGLGAINFNDDPTQTTLAIRKTICKIFRLYVDRNIYLHKESNLFHHETMVLWAGTDNRSKNTYYRLNPFAKQTVGGVEYNWPNMEMNDDDLDTIFKTNNSGIQSKPYYALERDPDTENDGYHWEGQDNVLNNTLLDAYGYGYLETAEVNLTLSNMMGTIFDKMQDLAGGKTMPDGTAVENSPVGCFDYYFFYIQKYFPAVAFNETARIRYEVPAILYRSRSADDGGEDYPQDPIAQSLGDQYDSEKDYVRRRLTMLAGYAGYRMSQFGFRGYKGTFRVALKPHQYIYPMYEVGDQRSSQPQRTMQRVNTSEVYAMTFSNSNATNGVYLYFIGSMREIGNIASWSDGTASGEAEDTAMTPSAARLVKFEMWSDAENGVTFKPKSGSFNFSAAQNLEEINVRNASALTNLDGLSGLVRLRSIDARGTAITALELPSSPNLTTLRLPDGYEEIRLNNCPNLELLTIEGYSALKTIVIGGTTSLDMQSIINGCMRNSAPLETLSLRNIQWSDVTNTLLNYIVSIPNVTLTGAINMAQGQTGYIDFVLKKKLIERFGNVDSEGSALRIIYSPQVLGSVLVSGDGYFAEVGEVKHYDIIPAGASQNTIIGYQWSIDAAHEDWATVDALGNVTCLKMGEEFTGSGEEGTLTVTVDAYDATGEIFQETATMKIRFYTRSAKVGDYVYHDGTYDDRLNRSKDVVGICFYVNPNDPTDRRMVALKDIASYQWGLYPTGSSISSVGFPDSGDNALKYDSNNDGTPDTAPFDIPASLLPNISSTGSVVQQTYTDPEDGVERQAGTSLSRVRYETMIDPNTLGFVDYAANTAIGRGLGELVALGEEIKNALFNNNNSITADTMVPQGFRDTCGAIVHRNRVLEGTEWTVGDVTTKGSPKFKPNDITVDNLAQKIIEIRQYAQNDLGATYPDIYSQYLYPAASAAFAYEPAVTGDHVLLDKFKHNHWYLPSGGELCRLAYYHLVERADSKYKHVDVNGKVDDKFNNAVVAQKFTRFAGTYYWSSTEYGSGIAWNVYFSYGYINTYLKYYSFTVRPVAAF